MNQIIDVLFNKFQLITYLNCAAIRLQSESLKTAESFSRFLIFLLLLKVFFLCYRNGQKHRRFFAIYIYYCCLNKITYVVYCKYERQIRSKLSLYSLHYTEACNELSGLISASLCSSNKAFFEEMSQRWRAVGNNESNLTGPRFEP